METTTLTLSDKCPKCGTQTLELDPEGDIHCWACGTTHGKPEKRDYLLERHQFYEKNKTAILADVESIGAHATAKKWKVNGASLFHVLQRWQREEGQQNTKPKRQDRRGRNYGHLPAQKHKYFEKNKDAIVADLLSLGRAAVRAKWGIGKSALTDFERKWLSDEQRGQITSLGIKSRINGRLPAFPAFSDSWAPEVQCKWLEIYEKILDKQEVKDERH